MGCEGCARIILLVFNLIFFLVGAACLGVGIWVVVDDTIFLQVLAKIPEDTSAIGSLIGDAAYILIGTGAAIFLIAFFGCCGAWKKNKCLLIVYSVIIGILVLLQIACLVTAYFFYDKVIDTLNSHLALALNASYTSTFTPTGTLGTYDYVGGNIISKGIDAIQIEFECCGVAGFSDYYNSDFPESCCPAETSGTIKDLVNQLWKGDMSTYTTTKPTCSGNTAYLESQNITGCVDAIKTYVQSKSIIFMGIAGGTLAVQIVLIILGCCVAKAVGDEEKNNFA